MLSNVTEHTEVQFLVNFAYPMLSQCANERPSPPETNNIATKNFQGGEGLSLAHWLIYEKLNLCILCGNVRYAEINITVMSHCIMSNCKTSRT